MADMSVNNIFLNIRKTNSSHRRCTIPNCGIVANLRYISRIKRVKAMKTQKIFIPNGARACTNHFSLENWGTNTQLINQFTSSQLEDMISLLCDSENISNSPGKYFYALGTLFVT